ncbi:MAG: hypothetical protein FWC28_06080 [Proteobacteria bacterium]|nr:hypothetical protein [Cystobacterineae bacterium]MCL2258824.1 hypothetical protein [Cystobacterineae bacterium]MCL2314801.1 hypothetical protein [Pseudomonadota bacterium]
MKWLQRAALWLLLGALLGSFLVLCLYPYLYMPYKLPSLWNEGACRWSECVQMASSRLRSAQLWGAAIGALVVALAGEIWLWRRRKARQQQVDTPSSAD